MRKTSQAGPPLRGALAPQVKAHWLAHRPNMSAALERAGLLNESVQTAADLTSDAMAQAIEQGQSYDQAWETLREEWAFLPSEEDVPELGFDPAALPLRLKRQADS